MTDEKELPEVWIDAHSTILVGGYRFEAGPPAIRCVPAARLDALRAELEATKRDAARLREALGALGVIGNGYCFCSYGRDPNKLTHQPECRDAMRAIDAARKDQP